MQSGIWGKEDIQSHAAGSQSTLFKISRQSEGSDFALFSVNHRRAH